MSETHDHHESPPNAAESFWEKQLREGKSQLESLWTEAQKAQQESLRRARVTADELAQSLSTSYAQTSERVTQLAAEARTRGKELLARAQERWGKPGSSASDAPAEASAPATEPEAAKAETSPADHQ